MDIDELFGLPAHPLLVHLPLILVPLGALTALVAVAWPRHRRRVAWLAAGLIAIALVTTHFAVVSGEALEDRVQRTDLVRRHVAMGAGVRTFVVLLLIAVLLLAVLPQSSYTSAQARRRRMAVAGAGVAIVLFAGAAVVTVVRTGHSGVKAVWDDTAPAGTLPPP